MIDHLQKSGGGIKLDVESRRLARGSSRHSQSNSSRIDKLEQKFAQLSLVTEALWEIVLKETSLDEESLPRMIDNVVVSRKLREQSKRSCTSCDQSMPAHFDKCMYCGGSVQGERIVSPFDR